MIQCNCRGLCLIFYVDVLQSGHFIHIEEYYFNNEHTFVGTPPAPRSGCCMVPLSDGKVLIHGGYSKEKVKKDLDKGHVYNDSFLLSPDSKQQVKIFIVQVLNSN